MGIFAVFWAILPGRKIPLITDQVYHVVNRGVASQPIFLNKWNYERAFETILYYQNIDIPFKYSFYKKLSKERKAKFLNQIQKKRGFWVDIISYCLMPNHLHLLLKQLKDGGISTFMSNFSNSYTRYFNIKNERNGHLFQGKFKAVRIGTDDQLLHVSRYIHLNPHTSYLVKDLRELEVYTYSSLREYLDSKIRSVCNKNLLLNHFRSRKAYRKFIFDQADYQRKLDRIKHLVLEK